jgi:hypothetical protein
VELPFRAKMASPSLAELAQDPGRIREVAPQDALRLLVQVGALSMALAGRMAEGGGSPSPAAPPSPQTCPGRWLTLEQAADVCGVSKRQIYSWSRQSEWRRFTRKLSRKALRVEERGLQRWLDSRPAVGALARRW